MARTGATPEGKEIRIPCSVNELICVELRPSSAGFDLFDEALTRGGRVAPGDCSPEALTRSGQGDFHHPMLSTT